MDETKRQLVERITEEVIAAMKAVAPGPRVGQRAEIHPPIGTCTGDYSKFEELRGPAGGGSAKPQAAEAKAIPLSGIVTAKQLQDAVAASVDGVVWLGHDARLTPLANDLARQKPAKFPRVSATNAAPGNPGYDSPWLWWIDGHCPVAMKLMQERSGHVRPSSAARQSIGLGQVVRDVAEGLRTGSIRGAMLFVPNAARAMCFANRCGSIRAVLGSCGEAVEQGVNELGMNVLVVEYPHVAPAKMKDMVDRMLAHAPKAPAPLQRELADLHRCG